MHVYAAVFLTWGNVVQEAEMKVADGYFRPAETVAVKRTICAHRSLLHISRMQSGNPFLELTDRSRRRQSVVRSTVL